MVVTSFPMMHEGKHCVGQIVRDITRQKMIDRELEEYRTQLENMVGQRTEELRLSQQAMHAVLNNIDANIIVTDFRTSKILFANDKIKESLGDVEGRPCWQVMHDGTTDVCSFCPRKYLLDADNKPTGIYRWEYQNKKDLNWYECTDVAIEWVDGRLVHLQYAININARKQAEMDLVHAKEKAEESDKLKSAFLANMSHEIRTPLNGIVGFLKFIDNDDISSERRHEYLNIVNNSSMQLAQIINDIVDVSKIEANQMNIYPGPVKLNDLMNELKLFFETYLQSKNKDRVSLILDDSGFIDNCTIYVDATRLRQILTNLIGNAVKFTEKGYIRFGYRKSAPDMLEFVVEDSGIGLSDNQQEVIFERFRQADENGNQFGGTGLGLTISRSLVQMKGGKMWVESSEGKGSSFYFTISYLPVSPHDVEIFADNSEVTPSDEKPFAGKSVLFVEPVGMKYKYYKRLTTATGVSVTQAKDLHQWHEILQTDVPIELVIADGSLFDYEEFDDVSRIKNVRPDLPVVLFVSEKKREKYMKLVRQKLCNATVELPIEYSDVSKILEKYVK
jgi:signal transduction histidine kinase